VDLLLIRHAESVNNAQEHLPFQQRERSPDPVLSELGERQAEQVAGAFSAGAYPRPEHLYCSLMRRAVATGAALADVLDLRLVAHPEAFETFGPLQYTGTDWASSVAHPGASRAELLAVSPRLVLPDIAGDGGWWPGPVETWEQAKARARRFAADLLARHGDGADVVAVVSHGSFGHLVLHELLGTPSPRVWLELGNTSVTLITGLREGFGVDADLIGGDGPRPFPHTILRYLGRTTHLAP
jgi:2,3-bisphosphoglycerate-dependent phosphoglycerate mutase